MKQNLFLISVQFHDKGWCVVVAEIKEAVSLMANVCFQAFFRERERERERGRETERDRDRDSQTNRKREYLLLFFNFYLGKLIVADPSYYFLHFIIFQCSTSHSFLSSY